MCYFWRMKPSIPLYAPERGGDALKGGRPSKEKISEDAEIKEMSGEPIGGHGKVPPVNEVEESDNESDES
jgi:hypothetical protein